MNYFVTGISTEVGKTVVSAILTEALKADYWKPVQAGDLEDSDSHLVIEGAGGLLVPLNDEATIMDLILPADKVVVVSRHYLGSINHTLLTVEKLLEKDLQVGIIFSGDEHPTTESIILKKTQVPFLGRINEEQGFDKATVKRYAEDLRSNLLSF